MKPSKKHALKILSIFITLLSLIIFCWAVLWLQIAISGHWFQAIRTGVKTGLPAQVKEWHFYLKAEASKKLSENIEEVKYTYFPFPKIVLVVNSRACSDQYSLHALYWSANHSRMVGEVKMDGPNCLDENHKIHYEMP